MTMKNKIKFSITIALLCVLGVLLYYHFSNSPDKGEENEKTDNVSVGEVEKLISKDIENNYPITVKETIELFTRIQKCYYNEDYSQEQLVKLAYMALNLMDEELKEINSFDKYFENLSEDIKLYKKHNRTISRVILDKSSEVVYSTIKEKKYASINCIYYLKTGNSTQKTKETYVLRKDENDRWKILGWQLSKESEE